MSSLYYLHRNSLFAHITPFYSLPIAVQKKRFPWISRLNGNVVRIMNIIEVEIEVEKPVENVDDDEGGRKSPARHNVYETDTISGLQVGRQSALQYRTQYKLWVSSLGEINTVMCYSFASYHMVTVSCKCRSLMPSIIYIR